jgi:hypothetical protein
VCVRPLYGRHWRGGSRPCCYLGLLPRAWQPCALSGKAQPWLPGRSGSGGYSGCMHRPPVARGVLGSLHSWPASCILAVSPADWQLARMLCCAHRQCSWPHWAPCAGACTARQPEATGRRGHSTVAPGLRSATAEEPGQRVALAERHHTGVRQDKTECQVSGAR